MCFLLSELGGYTDAYLRCEKLGGRTAASSSWGTCGALRVVPHWCYGLAWPFRVEMCGIEAF